MHAIQIVLTCFAVFAFSRAVIQYRRGSMRMLHLGLWLLVWGCVVVVALRPEMTDLLANWLGVGRGVDTAMYFAFLMIFYLLFRSFAKIENLDRQLTRVVRANALREMERDLAEAEHESNEKNGRTQT
jgi:small membrane protein